MPRSLRQTIAPGLSKPKKPSGPQKFAVAILAAGMGTRLKSQHPKVLHQIAGRPLLQYVIEAATALVPPADVFAVIGHEAERVRAAVAASGVQFVVQQPQRGTGHALMVAREALQKYDHVLVLSGDVPLIRPATITRVRDFHLAKDAAMTILTAEPPDPTGYGRVLRRLRGLRPADDVLAIVEQKALTPEQRDLREINSGIYAFAARPLFAHLDQLGTDNAHHEFYLTDMAALLAKAKETVVALKAEDAGEVLGINTRAELARLDALLRERKCAQLMEAGVTIYRPETCTIDAAVEAGADTVLEPFVQLLGSTRVGANCRIRSYSVISDSQLADGVEVRPGCIIEGSRLAAGAVIGPYAHLRPGSEIGEGAHVGNFVETKKARLGKGSKANHLTYLGDAEIGDGVNVGAGTITCNYDGAQKHKTLIEDGAFIGSDTTLVAPVKVGRGSYIGAGSSITDDVPPDSLAIARARQINKEGWAAKKRAERGKK
ncbi:MAG TPA: bifunctional UDP-N-acetylglucosamine diphosphorylase/glucosamine-1-phosphate N-acetyltransferase GlmU [Terriglobales bacterium]|jgi:bifunctional UDP-N-acetylglucosamine pyrophosphorylase/glucosamine-1-phosphate N-acetyltransferase|nr:bifunctional UDP-N-acetylglucosamine diphosphorylase/glucosamine-1-phosphate N-acetyltransferase GlmU [Terriglobales bacterium]